MLILFIVTGAIIGGILGEIIRSSAALGDLGQYVVKPFPIFDIPPVTINLYVIKLVAGLTLSPNLISILGAVIAAALFRRL